MHASWLLCYCNPSNEWEYDFASWALLFVTPYCYLYHHAWILRAVTRSYQKVGQPKSAKLVQLVE